MQESLIKKWEALQAILKGKELVAVAFSGGVDSSFLLWAAHHVLGDRVFAVTIQGEMVPALEIQQAKQFAETVGIEQTILPVNILEVPGFCQNSAQRCYYCKKYLFEVLIAWANERNAMVVEGSNVDDTADYRPGQKALRELQIASPLLEAGLTKSEIRKLAHHFGLDLWDKPSSACLASRVPYDTRITKEILGKIELAEAFLHDLGIQQVRVRYHGEIAKLEVEDDDLEKLLNHRQTIACRLREYGFSYVAVDLEPYRTGRLNENLQQNF